MAKTRGTGALTGREWVISTQEHFAETRLVCPIGAVAVLSETNTPREIARKLKEYFEAGCHLAWIIDPKTRTADVYTASDECRHLRPTSTTST